MSRKKTTENIVFTSFFSSRYQVFHSKFIILKSYFFVVLSPLQSEFEVDFKQNNKKYIFTTIFATFYIKIAVKWSKSRIF